MRTLNGSLDLTVKRLNQRHAERKAKFVRDVQKLAQQVADQDKLIASKTILKEIDKEKSPQHRLIALRLPRQKTGNLAKGIPLEDQNWFKTLRKLKLDYARDLYLLSPKFRKARRPSFAFELIREVLKHDPDHIKARSLLGFVQYKTEWVTPFEREKLRARYKNHTRFGWLPATHIERYEKGERFYNGRWISEAREAEIRRDFSNAWVIRTEHFLIKTNHSLERGVELGRALEDFHWFFRSVFVAFYSAPNQSQKLFDSTSSKNFRPESDLYEVHFFRTQKEYIARLIKHVPMIAVTNGLYRHSDRVAYFYDHPQLKSNGTLFHEATHQLMHESSRTIQNVGIKDHFWGTEAIACYMESFHRGESFLSVGDPRHARIYAARHHLINDRYQVPLLLLADQGQERYQQEATIADLQKKYAQGAGLAHFFLHHNHGEYRDAFLKHLSQIYSTSKAIRNHPLTMEGLTGHSYPELDLQYRDYIKMLHEQNPARMQLVPNSKQPTAPNPTIAN